ncbi:MAG: 3'-5' exonuclease [Bacilli bacterium]
MNNNYRSGSEIIDLANRVIAQADDVLNMQSICMSGKKGEVKIDSKYKIDEYLKDLTDYKDWFILVRTNKDLMKLEQKMIQFQIPYISFRKGEITLDEMRKCMAEDKVKLLTIHTSKGLESKNVLMWGNFPIRQKPYMRNNDELKVEYVGMTRTIDKLIVLN